MAGTIIRVIPRRPFDFTAVSSGQGLEIVLADRIDVSAWRQVALMVRTHANSISGGGSAIGRIAITVYEDGRTDNDPGVLFAGVQRASVLINATGAYALANLGSNLGPMVKITAKGSRTGSSGANLIAALVSVDLSCRTA